MQPNNTTMPNVASQAISVSAIVTQNRSIVNILFDIREGNQRRDRLVDYYRFLHSELSQAEHHYEQCQIQFDDDQTSELLEVLCQFSSEIVGLSEQLSKTEAELDQITERLSSLHKELFAVQKGSNR